MSKNLAQTVPDVKWCQSIALTCWVIPACRTASDAPFRVRDHSSHFGVPGVSDASACWFAG